MFVVDNATGAVVKDVEVKGHWSLPGVFSESDATVIGYTSGAGEAKLDSERFTDKKVLHKIYGDRGIERWRTT